MLRMLDEKKHNVSGGGRNVALLAPPQFLSRVGNRVFHNCSGRIDDSRPPGDEREKRIVFFPALDEGPTAKPDIKAGPCLEYGASEGHVCTVPERSKIRKREPVRSGSINDESSATSALCRGLAYGAQDLIGTCSSRQNSSCDCHDLRIIEFRS